MTFSFVCANTLSMQHHTGVYTLLTALTSSTGQLRSRRVKLLDRTFLRGNIRQRFINRKYIYIFKKYIYILSQSVINDQLIAPQCLGARMSKRVIKDNRMWESQKSERGSLVDG